MKKAICTLLCFLPLLSAAQTNEGQYFYSGTVSFLRSVNRFQPSFQPNPPAESRARALSGSFAFRRGVFVRDNVAVIGEAGLSYSGTRASQPFFDFSSQTVAPNVGLLVRRYFGQQQWRFFAGGGLTASAGFMQRTVPISQGSGLIANDERTNTIQINPIAELGLVYFLTDRWAVELTSQTQAFPFQVSSFNVGLIRTGTLRTYETTQTYPNEATTATQLAKGNMLVSGTISFSSQNVEQENALGTSLSEQNQTEFRIAPAVGWFVRNNRLLGISVGYTHSRGRSTGLSSSQTSVNRVEIGPFYRQYIGQNRLRPFVGGSASWQFIRSGGFFAGDREGISNNLVTLGASAGLAYLLGERFLVETTLADVSYQFDNVSNNLSRTRTLQAGAGMRPFFTVSYVFR